MCLMRPVDKSKQKTIDPWELRGSGSIPQVIVSRQTTRESDPSPEEKSLWNF